MIALSYNNFNNIPIFGFGAKTTKKSTKPANVFPLTRSIRNPFVYNDDETIDLCY